MPVSQHNRGPMERSRRVDSVLLLFASEYWPEVLSGIVNSWGMGEGWVGWQKMGMGMALRLLPVTAVVRWKEDWLQDPGPAFTHLLLLCLGG